MNVPEEVPEEHFETSFLVPSLADADIADDYDFAARDINASIIGQVPMLVERSRHAARGESRLSYSHRGFLVGATAVAYDPNPESPRIGTYTAGNFKAKLKEDERTDEDVEDIPKLCAEMDISLRVAGDNLERIAIFVVAATTNRERIAAITELAGATLEPCNECENVMSHSDLIDDHTIIMTVGKFEDVFQVQDFASLARRYRELEKGKRPKPLPVYTYSSYDWEDRQAQYTEARYNAGLPAATSMRKKRAETQCQRLALEAMVA